MRIFSKGNRRAPSQLSFLRHAECVTNVLRTSYCFDDEDARNEVRRLSGGSLANQDSPLTPQGIEQAREAGPRIWSTIGMPHVIVCSPHFRTRQTLELILETLPTDVDPPRFIFDSRIRERESAPVSNMTLAEVGRYFPWLQDHLANTGDFYFRYPNGESLADLVDGRARSFLTDVHRVYAGANVLVLTHGNFIKCIRMLIEGWLPDNLRKSGHVNPSNCGLVRYRSEFNADGEVSMRLHSIY